MEKYKASLGMEWQVTDEEHHHSNHFLDEIDERMASILDRWDGRVSISGPHPSRALLYTRQNRKALGIRIIVEAAHSYPMREAAG